MANIKRSSSKNISSFFLIYLAIGILIYFNSFDNAFQFDDYDFIVNNYNIRDLFDISAIWNTLAHPSRFIGFLTFAVNFHFGQLDVLGYHIVNTVIHIINAALVCLCTRALLEKKSLKEEKVDGAVVAFIAGLLFLVHPLQTQAVAYISQRFTSLAAVFYLFSVFNYLRYHTTQKGIYAALMIVSAVCGMLTKPIVFTLPILIIILDQVFLKRDKPCLNKTHVCILLLLLVIVPWTMRFNASSILGMTTLSGSHDGDVINWFSYLLTQMRVIIMYLTLFFAPVGQTLDHDVALSTSFLDLRVISSLTIIITIWFLAVIQYKKRPIVGFCVAWFFITLVVTSSIIPIHHVMFEHRVYLPSVGLCILVSYLAVRFLNQGRLYIPLVMILLIVLSVMTVRRNAVWDNDILLWGDVVQKAPQKSRGYRSLAVAYYKRDDYPKALQFIQKAIMLYPEYLEAYETRGRILYMMGDFTNALTDYNYILFKNPRHALAYKDRADLWGRQDKLDQALADYNTSISIHSGNPHAYNGRARVYAKRKQIDLALADINHAIAIDAYQSEFYNNRGIILSMAGRHIKALQDFHKSLSLNENQPEVQKNIATVKQILEQN